VTTAEDFVKCIRRGALADATKRLCSYCRGGVLSGAATCCAGKLWSMIEEER
jgi:hypothetical protein